MIEMLNKVFDKICFHAQECYPDECCGILIGRHDGDRRTVQLVYPVENSAVKNKKTHFFIDPPDVFRAEIYAQEKNLEITGFYHSHPDSEAIVSTEDIRFMIPQYSYPIISVRNGKATEIRCYVKTDNNAVCEEPIIKER